MSNLHANLTFIIREMTAAIKLQALQSDFAETFCEQQMLTIYHQACEKVEQLREVELVEEKVEIGEHIEQEQTNEVVQEQPKELEQVKTIKVDITFLKEAVWQTLDNYRDESFTMRGLKNRIIDDFQLASNALANTKALIQEYIIAFRARDNWIHEGIEHYSKESKRLNIAYDEDAIRYRVIREYEEKERAKYSLATVDQKTISRPIVDLYEFLPKANEWECPNCLCNVSKKQVECPACTYVRNEIVEEIVEEKAPIIKESSNPTTKSTKKPTDKSEKKTDGVVCAFHGCSVKCRKHRVLSDGKIYCGTHHKQMEKKLSK